MVFIAESRKLCYLKEIEIADQNMVSKCVWVWF